MSISPRFLSLLALAAFVACGPRENATTDSAAGMVDTAAPMAANNVAVTQVDLGKSVGADKRVTSSMTEFAPTDTVYASVATSGSSPSATLQAKWTFEDGQVVDSSTQTIAPTGPAVTEFHISTPDGFPKGKYRVEVMLNGMVASSKEFTVR
jgi:hypothetical protein